MYKFYYGKGGVGKTSYAASLAMHFANNGHPTLPKGRLDLPPSQRAVGHAALSSGGWWVNRPLLWRLRQPPFHLAAG
jgi:Mrp family chromosome partitioning ATPase